MNRNNDEVRKISQKDGNRYCMECGMRWPVYVVVEFYIFVCSTCAALHRSHQHKVKGINMTEFTDEEVTCLRICGNDGASAVWLKRYTRDKPSHKNGTAVSDFIAAVFARAEYVSEEEYEKLQWDILQAITGSFTTVDSAPTANPDAPDIFCLSTPQAQEQLPHKEAMEEDLFSAFRAAAPLSNGRTQTVSAAHTRRPEVSVDELFSSIPSAPARATASPQVAPGIAGVQNQYHTSALSAMPMQQQPMTATSTMSVDMSAVQGGFAGITVPSPYGMQPQQPVLFQPTAQSVAWAPRRRYSRTCPKPPLLLNILRGFQHSQHRGKY
ncbi:putative GTPase activating protein for Arf [Trypanosoma vivax]|uniref:ADP-ribosylation factor GTPase activating protein, putative n=1 Tax=Trypanosoma vivax (strain Y486) TaxID=1055687 RepID=F9WSU5_TRYVY|nr:putative GTPase activating protein for Arf [Trypanosoma vivax]CCD20634.1 ADP-ribosylation factor GTPase activating protein, putative [Trypanosoma vivax Y486]|eukprot:CCD20634.1 ADP-ribosylation factor GTPase activating protein, putative [Trypanosoma vivax Y486]